MYHMMREDRGLGLGVRSAARARSDTGRQGGLEAGASSASRVNLACKYATQDDTPVDRPVVVVRSGLLAVQARTRITRGPPPPPPPPGGGGGGGGGGGARAAAGRPGAGGPHPGPPPPGAPPPPPPPPGGRPSSLLVSLPRQDATASLASPPTRRRWLCSLHIAVHLSQPHRTHPRPTRERDRSVGQDAGRRREATARACRARDSQAWPILYPRRLRDPCHILLRGHVVVYYFAAFARAALALWPDRSTPKTGVVGPAGAVTNGVSILAKQRSRLDVARRLYYVTEAAAFSCDAMPFFHGL
jgi:hypothetical protein